MSVFSTARNFFNAIDATMSVVESLANTANKSVEILANNVDDMLKENEKDRKIREHLDDEERRLNFYRDKERLQTKFKNYSDTFRDDMDKLLASLK